MTEIEQVQEAYKIMYEAMSAKEMERLSSVLDDSFVLVHMTGTRQPKAAFMAAVRDGALNYRNFKHEKITVEIDGDQATLIGHTQVEAAFTDGNWRTWRLAQKIQCQKKNNQWMLCLSEASTY